MKPYLTAVIPQPLYLCQNILRYKNQCKNHILELVVNSDTILVFLYHLPAKYEYKPDTYKCVCVCVCVCVCYAV